MRDIRQKGSDPIQYKVRPETKIESIPMHNLLAHDKTKVELSEFLSNQILKFGETNNKEFVISWRNKAASSHGDDVSCLSSMQEADTKIILHAAYLAQKVIKTTHVFFPDTDVLILALRRYPQLSKEFAFYLGHGMKGFAQIGSIYRALGPLKPCALPGQHALSGTDVTGSFAGKGKIKWWKAFNSASDTMIEALAKLGTTLLLTEDVRANLEALLCTSPKYH